VLTVLGLSDKNDFGERALGAGNLGTRPTRLLCLFM